MDAFLARVPLVGPGPIIVITAIALFFLVMALMARRHHTALSIGLGVLVVVVGLAAAADVVNTRNATYPTAADLFGVAPVPGPATAAPVAAPTPVVSTPPASASTSTTAPTSASTTASPTSAPPSTPTPTVAPQPDGQVTSIQVPDTASHFGAFDAKVWLPPQYFTEPEARFPVVVLIHGNPGTNNDWLASGNAAASGLASAKAGKPVILVFPTVLQTGAGDSLCLDTASQGNAETYITQDLVAAVDGQLRTKADPRQRGIGGLSMGGYCSLNLGLKHPDVFSAVMDFSGATSPIVDTLSGGLPALFGASWQRQATANNPSTYFSTVNPATAPAIWMDCGTDDKGTLSGLAILAPQMKAKGFAVELHTRPGNHEFSTWSAALADALPWAAGRFAAAS